MVFLQEFIKLRTEQARELTHLELDRNLQYVANPWNPERAYLEGMIVYHTDSTTGSTAGLDDLTWFRANKDNGPNAVFDPADWDPIGTNAQTGEVIVKDSNGIFASVGVVELTDKFTVSFLGNTALIDVSPGAFNIWQEVGGGPTIAYEDNVLIGTSTIINPSYKLSVAGSAIITGDLDVSGDINGIDLVAFYNDYADHTHTIVPTSLTNYTSLYPDSNGQLADVQLSGLTDGDFLTWDNSLKRWVNTTIAVGPHAIGDHTDVAASASIGPVNNQVLIYNSGTTEWKNVSLTLNNSTGFLGAPFAHNHDGRYYTKTELLASTGSLINWDNLFNTPTFAPANATYITTSLSGDLSSERVLTQGTGIIITDNGPNSTIVVEQDPRSVVQLTDIQLDGALVGTRPILNFITPASGDIGLTVTDDGGNNRVNVEVDFTGSFTAPVDSVNGYTGIVDLGVSDMNDVSIIPGNFPGPATGSPYTPGTNILAYDDDISKWINIPVTSLIAGLSSIYLDDILDVDIAVTALQDKNILYYDQGSGLWLDGHPNDANMYDIDDLLTGALDVRYFTETELSVSGGGSAVHWDNITNVPSFAPASHTHYLYEMVDVYDYNTGTAPNNGDILVWNTGTAIWEPAALGTIGFKTIINNSSVAGTYTSALDESLSVSDVNPLKFQADVGIFLETDTTNNIVKIGAAVDGVTIGFNTNGELSVIGGNSCLCDVFGDLPTGVNTAGQFLNGRFAWDDNTYLTEAFNDLNIEMKDVKAKSLISLKNLYGRAMTDINKTLYDETELHKLVVDADNVFIDSIDSDPMVAELMGVVEFVTADLVEDVTSNGQAYYAVYPTGHVNAGEVITQAVSPAYGNSYQVVVKDNTASVIPTSDASNWIYQYNSGVFYMQDPSLITGTPTTIEMYVYTGALLSDISSIIGDDGDWDITTGDDVQMGVNGNILPYADDINDIGTSGLRFKDIYIGSTIDFLTDLDFANNATNIAKVTSAGLETYDDKVITAVNGNSTLDLRAFSTNNTILLSTAGDLSASWLYADSTIAQIGVNASAGETNGVPGMIIGKDGSGAPVGWDNIHIQDVTLTNVTSRNASRLTALFLNASRSTIEKDVDNSLIGASYSAEIRALSSYSIILASDIGGGGIVPYINKGNKSALIAVTGSSIDSASVSAIIATTNGTIGIGSNITGLFATQSSIINTNTSRSAIIGGSGHIINPGLSDIVILGGDSVTATVSDRVYIGGELYVKTVNTDVTATDALFIDSNGVIVKNTINTTPVVDGITIDFNTSGELEVIGYPAPPVDGVTIDYNTNGELEAIGGGGSTQIMSPDDKFITALDTVSDGDPATATGITNTPVSGSYVAFRYNGVDYEVGNGNKNKAVYFSGDGGTTARTFNDIQAGDIPYWNGSQVSGLQLKAGGRVSLEYLVNA